MIYGRVHMDLKNDSSKCCVEKYLHSLFELGFPIRPVLQADMLNRKNENQFIQPKLAVL